MVSDGSKPIKTSRPGSNQNRPIRDALFVSGFLMQARTFQFLPATAPTSLDSSDLLGFFVIFTPDLPMRRPHLPTE